MTQHFADRLQAAIELKGSPVCAGIDPSFEKLPDAIKAGAATDSDRPAAIEAFCLEVLEIVAPIVPAIKIQSAYFEVYGHVGVKVYDNLVQRAQELGLLVIGDVKRNDIGSTAAAYAEGHLLREGSPDAITVNGYLGEDGLVPFIEAAQSCGKGLFVLVRTSNPSAASIQDFTDSSGKKFYEHVAEMVAAVGDEAVGECGQSLVGAVVGATYPDEARKLRSLMARQIFLVPGYGAQGASAGDCAASFKADGTGAIVNASRSVIFAFGQEQYADLPWAQAVEQAARAFAADIAGAVKP